MVLTLRKKQEDLMGYSFKRFFAKVVIGLTSLASAAPGICAPVTIDYELNSLASPGRYEYRYNLTNVSLSATVSWFSVDFDPALYAESSLLITSTGLANWSQQLLASIGALGVPAQYDALKTSGAPLGVGESEAGFTVEFTWLGTGSPGSQAFAIYDPVTLDVINVGLTNALGAPPPPPPTLPEPSTMALVLLALAGIATVGHQSSRRVAARQVAAAGRLMDSVRPA
jgi:hypothetical protein